MKIYKGFDNVDIKGASVVTIGTYDGIHKGHMEVLEKLVSLARIEACESVVITFYPHPRLVLYPDQSDLKLIDTEEEKIEKFTQVGVDSLIVVPFDKDFAKISYTSFVEKFLVKKLNIRKFVIGKDHKFGNNREGDIDAMLALAVKYKFSIEYLELHEFNGLKISSTKIRKAVLSGDIEAANCMTGHLFKIKATVVEGKKIGQGIGFPTANLKVDNPDKLLPAEGVYAVFVLYMGDKFKGMLNIGKNPSVSNDNELKIEVNIFDFNKIIYGEFVELFFVKRLRDELKFENISLLKNQLEKDKISALDVLSNNEFAI